MGATPSPPIDPVQLRLAERRLLDALRRYHRREPLRADLRVDALVGLVLSTTDARPPSHRGATPLLLDEAALRSVIDGLVERGAVSRRGHRVWLPDHQPGMGPAMRERVDRLLGGLNQAGAMPPPLDALAARFGVPPAIVSQLRAAGEVVSVAPGIDYPRAAWGEITRRLERLARFGPLTIVRVRDDLGASRRHAEAILLRHRDERRRAGRRAGPAAGPPEQP